MYAFIPWELVVDPLGSMEHSLGTAVLASENHGLPNHYNAHSQQRSPLTSIRMLYPTLSLPHFVCSSFYLHPTDRILPTYLYSHRMYTKQLELAVYLSSHRTQQPRHLCHLFYRSQSRKFQMTKFHADSNSVLSVFCTTQITDSLKNDSLKD